MPNEKTDTSEAEIDVSIARAIYPEAAQIFSAQLKTPEQIKDDSLIVLDTNVLLVPYGIGKDSLQQIQVTYEKLIREKRLIIPGQVSREFAKNRANKLTELYQQFNRKITKMDKLQKGKYPLLESVSFYGKVVHIEEKIDKLLDEYKKAIQDLLGHIRGWAWNDPVSLLYANLFTKDVVFDLEVDKDKFSSEWDRRRLYSIPPGYKDSGKIGDFLIWLTILEIGKTHNRNLIFVSGEEKADWFHRSEGQPLYPRYELVDEYRRHSGGCTFCIVPFSQFLAMYGASKSIVDEVQEEEHKTSIEFRAIGEFIRTWAIFEKILFEKCEEVKPGELQPYQATAYKMIQMLAKYQALPPHFSHVALEMTQFRNKLVHGHPDFIPIDAVESALETLNDLMAEL